MALTNVEAQRVLAVVDELCADLATLNFIPAKGLADHPEVLTMFPEHLRGYVDLQIKLEAKLQQLTPSLREPVSEFLPDKDQPERTQGEETAFQQFLQVSRALRRNTRDLVRIIRQEPHLGAMLSSVFGDSYSPPVLSNRFAALSQQLRVQTLRSLSTSVEEERGEREHFEIVSQREKKLAQESKSLSKDLMAVKHERHKTVTVKDEQIQQYKNELKDLKAVSAKAGGSAAAGAGEKVPLGGMGGARKSELMETAQRAFNETKLHLQREIKKKEAELDRLKHENKEKEDAVAKRSFKKETDVESWITRYDQEMSDLNAEMLSTRESYEEERARLRMIEDYFDRLRLEEGGARLLECSKISEAAEEIARRNRMDVNAVKIQSAIRGHLMRKDLENKSKKKGKKGKGKGKKK